jgi:hypothetical protein
MRAPLIIPNEAREDSRTKDSWGVNCFLEREDADRAVKRPGLINTVDVVGSGTVGQGLFIWPSSNGPKVISLWDDTLWQYTTTTSPTTFPIEFAWDFSLSGSGASIAYSGGTSYTTGQRALYSNGTIVSDEELPSEQVVWYCVSNVTGVAPAHSTAAYPYWSRYPDKPVGPHPTMFAGWFNQQSPPNPGPDDAYVITSRLTVFGNANNYNVTYSGVVSHNPGPFNFGDTTNTYSNYSGSPSWYLVNGYDEYPSTSHTTSSEVPQVAANDYSRSHLGV